MGLGSGGYWSSCLASREPVIRDLTVPVYDRNEIVAVVLVGNSATDYDDLADDLK